MDGSDKYEQDEFRWEASFRKDEAYIASYMNLLKRFSDLPECNQLILRQLGVPSSVEEDEAEGDFPDCDLNCKECPQRWQCDFALPDLSDEQAWKGDAGAGEDFFADEDPFEEEPTAPQPGDTLFYEQAPSFLLLRQTALGWCNIYATVLRGDSRFAGAKVLFYISRALAHLAASLGDGLYMQVGVNIAWGKRALQDLNQAVGLVNDVSREHPHLKELLSTVRGQLLKVREGVLAHIKERRRVDR